MSSILLFPFGSPSDLRRFLKDAFAFNKISEKSVFYPYS